MAIPFTPGELAREVLDGGRLVGTPDRLGWLWRWKWGLAEVWARGGDEPEAAWLVLPAGEVKLFGGTLINGPARALVAGRMRLYRQRRSEAERQLALADAVASGLEAAR